MNQLHHFSREKKEDEFNNNVRRTFYSYTNISAQIS